MTHEQAAYRRHPLDAEAPTVADQQVELRDRIRRAVCEAEGFAWDSDMLEPDEFGEVADAVLAVLPTPADRAAVSTALWAAAEHNTAAEWICCEPIDPAHDLCVQGGAALRMLKALLVDDPEAWKPAPLLDEMMRLLPPAGSVAEAHRLALSEVLDLGTGAPWDAIHERVQELRRPAVEVQQQETTPAQLAGILAAHTDSLAATIEGFTGIAASTLQPGLKRTLDFLRLYREQLLAGQLSAEMRRLLGRVAAEAQQPGPEHPLTVRYCNHRGETADRTVLPIRLWYGVTKWHPEEQWLLRAFDVDRGAERDFALADMQGARAAEGQPERPGCTCQFIAESWIKMDHAVDCPARATAETQQQPDTEAHPAEHSWAAELYDPTADEWVPGTRYLVRDRAVNALAHANKIGPTWKDGTPTQRRLVRATTTYTVEQPAAADTGEEAEA